MSTCDPSDKWNPEHKWSPEEETGRSRRLYGIDMDPVGQKIEYKQICALCGGKRKFWRKEVTG